MRDACRFRQLLLRHAAVLPRVDHRLYDRKFRLQRVVSRFVFRILELCIKKFLKR